MRRLIVSIVLFLCIINLVQAQDEGEIVYQYKNEPFQYDSGVSMSDRQYQFYVRQQKLSDAANVIGNGLNNKPQVIVVTERKKRKGDGKIWVWFTSGAGSILIAWAATSLKK